MTRCRLHLRHLGFHIVNDSLYNPVDRWALTDSSMDPEVLADGIRRLDQRAERRDREGEGVFHFFSVLPGRVEGTRIFHDFFLFKNTTLLEDLKRSYD